MFKAAQILALCVYICLFVAPITLHVLTPSNSEQLENRTLNKPPKLPQSWSALAAYTKQLSVYLEDHFGMRTRYLKTANRIKFHLFNELVSEQITIGNDGYIFFNSHSAVEPGAMLKNVCGQTTPTEPYQQEVMHGYARLLEYFTAKGIKPSMAIIPTKARIYPEKLPPRERRWCDSEPPTWVDQMTSKLHDSGYAVYQALDYMRSLKTKLPVYLPSHFHWHGQATKAIADDLMKTFWQVEPTTVGARPSYARVMSDFSSHLVGLRMWNDSVSYDYAAAGVDICIEDNCIPGLDAFFNTAPLTYSYELAHNNKTLLIVSDSFGFYLAPHFIEGFGRVIQVDMNGVDEEKLFSFYAFLLENFQPNYLLHLIHDGGIWGNNKHNQKLLAQIKQNEA